MSRCREAEKEAKCFLEWPTKGQNAPAIHQWCQREQINVQVIGYTGNLYFREHPQESPCKRERKTGNNGCEGSRVFDSLCRMLSYLSIYLSYLGWREQEDAESLHYAAQEGGKEQGSQQWNCLACPKDCAYH